MYLKKLLIIILITYTTALLLGHLFDMRYKKRYKVLFFDKMETILNNKKNYTVLFLGNSKMHFGINPYYVDSITGLQSYNIGEGGSDAEEILLYTKIYLQNHPAPKYAFLSLDGSTAVKFNRLKNRYWMLYYLRDSTVRTFMRNAGFKTNLIRIFPFLKYAYFDEYSRSAIFLKDPGLLQFDHNLYNGFINTIKNETTDTREWNKSKVFDPQTLNEKTDAINDTAINQLKEIISLFSTKRTKLFIIYPPAIKHNLTIKTEPKNPADSVYRTVGLQWHIPIIDINDKFNFPEKYFADGSHLNEPGTRIYSRLIGQFIDSVNKQ